MMFLLVNTADAADYKIETVTDGLSYPWAMAFLPGGDILITERSGQLRRINDGSLLPDPVQNLPHIYVGGQGGLMDILLDQLGITS